MGEAARCHYLINCAEIEVAIDPIHHEIDHRCLNEIKGLENPTSEMIAKWLWDRLRPQIQCVRIEPNSSRAREEWIPDCPFCHSRGGGSEWKGKSGRRTGQKSNDFDYPGLGKQRTDRLPVEYNMAMILKATEQALIRKAKAGDGRAIEGLIRAHQEALYAFMLRMSGRPDVAEDIVQEAFVRVLKNLDRFDTRFRFSTWLFTIAKRLYVNAMQKHRPTYDSDVVGSHQGETVWPGGVAAHQETMQNARTVIDFALAELLPQQREIILLFHQQNWPITEIALYFDMPEGTVKSHLHRARKRMKQAIESSETYSQHVAEVWS